MTILMEVYAVVAMVLAFLLVLQNSERLKRLGFWKTLVVFFVAPLFLAVNLLKKRRTK